MIKINLKQIRRKKPKATRAGGDGQRSGSAHRLSRPVFSSFLSPTLPHPGGGGGGDVVVLQVALGRWRPSAFYYLVLSSFSSSMSLRDALTLLETSFPWEKRRWRSLKVRLSGLPLGIEFSCSWLQNAQVDSDYWIQSIEHEKSHNYKGLGRADGIFCKSFVFVLCKGRTRYWKSSFRAKFRFPRKQNFDVRANNYPPYLFQILSR